jgi:hypothetical protein
MEPIEPRPWWRLEPEATADEVPSPLAPEYAEYSATHYRDRAATDSFLWQRLEAYTLREPNGPDPTTEEHYDPYGTPLSEEAGAAESWVGWANGCRRRAGTVPGPFREWFLSVATPGLLDRFGEDEALAAAIPPSPMQDEQPGSLVGIRHRGTTSFFESVTNLVDRSNTVEHHVWATGAGLSIYDAQLFWLPDPIGAECLTSEAPDPDLIERIRLPFDSVLVGLATPVPASALGIDDDNTWRTAMSADGGRDALSGEPHLAAVWMAAGVDGFGVAPVVVWFVETAGGVSAVPGIWERSAYAGAVANLGAVLTWENWVELANSTESMGEPGTKERRKALKKSSVRKAIARGAMHKVRVLVIPRREAPSSESAPNDDALGRRSPVRHWRRGHWTKVRMASRDAGGRIVGSTSGAKGVDWAYEGRWIRPVLVNPAGPPDPGAKVYKQVATST